MSDLKHWQAMMTGFREHVPVGKGYLDVCPSCDTDYPGVDIEFIPDPDNETENAVSRPRVLFERDDAGTLRALIWANPNSEDYTHCIEFKGY